MSGVRGCFAPYSAPSRRVHSVKASSSGMRVNAFSRFEKVHPHTHTHTLPLHLSAALDFLHWKPNAIRACPSPPSALMYAFSVHYPVKPSPSVLFWRHFWRHNILSSFVRSESDGRYRPDRRGAEAAEARPARAEERYYRSASGKWTSGKSEIMGRASMGQSGQIAAYTSSWQGEVVEPDVMGDTE